MRKESADLHLWAADGYLLAHDRRLWSIDGRPFEFALWIRRAALFQLKADVRLEEDVVLELAAVRGRLSDDLRQE